MKYLSNFDQRILISIIALKSEAYGVPIRQEVSASLGEDITVGRLYSALERLERQGFIKSYEGGITRERGGRRKRFFQICALGVNSLQETHQIIDCGLNQIALYSSG